MASSFQHRQSAFSSELSVDTKSRRVVSATVDSVLDVDVSFMSSLNFDDISFVVATIVLFRAAENLRNAGNFCRKKSDDHLSRFSSFFVRTKRLEGAQKRGKSEKRTSCKVFPPYLESSLVPNRCSKFYYS